MTGIPCVLKKDDTVKFNSRISQSFGGTKENNKLSIGLLKQLQPLNQTCAVSLIKILYIPTSTRAPEWAHEITETGGEANASPVDARKSWSIVLWKEENARSLMTFSFISPTFFFFLFVHSLRGSSTVNVRGMYSCSCIQTLCLKEEANIYTVVLRSKSLTWRLLIFVKERNKKDVQGDTQALWESQ